VNPPWRSVHFGMRLVTERVLEISTT